MAWSSRSRNRRIVRNVTVMFKAVYSNSFLHGDLQFTPGTSGQVLYSEPLRRPQGWEGQLKKSQSNVRLSRASLLGLKRWPILTAGDGRLICAGETSWCLDSDAGDVGFSATLGRDLTTGSSGDLEAQSILSPFRRLQSITLRELVAVREGLKTAAFQIYLRHQHRSTSSKTAILLHVDNMAVVRILSNMVSASPELLVELRGLHQLLTDMKVTIKAHWLSTDTLIDSRERGPHTI